MNNLTALDKPRQLLQLVFDLLWTTTGVDYLCLFLSHELCGHREHRSFWSVKRIKSIMNSQSICDMSGGKVCELSNESLGEECRRDKGTDSCGICEDQ